MTACAARQVAAGLLRALRRLEREQGPVARRNARAAVSRELARLRAVLDAEFPAPPRKKPEPVGRATRYARRQKRVDALSEVRTRAEVLTSTALLRLAEAGVHPFEEAGVIWVPDWALELVRLGASRAEIGRCKRSPRERALLLTHYRLKKDVAP